MKQLRIFSVLLMCLFALGFTACGGGDDDENLGGGNGTGNSGGSPTQFEKDDLYGGWKYESGESCRLYYFSEEDSSGIYIEDANLKNYDRQEITYNINDEVTSLTINKKGGIIKYTILSLTDQKLVLKDIEYEDTWTLKRYTGNIEKEFPVILNSGIINGHEWVNLGLSVKWACCNVGANTPEECGDYFAWGEIETKNEYYSGEGYSKNYGKNISDISGNVAYDAATANWGGSWRMPTKAEIQELIDNCTWTWTIVNGVKGYKVTSKINGNSIFISITGCYAGSSLFEIDFGHYWSSTPSPYKDNQYACCFYIYNNGYGMSDRESRGLGQVIRPVID